MQTIQADTSLLDELKKLSSITGEQDVNLENLQAIEVGIKDEIFDSCPQVIKNLIDQFNYRPDKETILVSYLAFISGILPNYHTNIKGRFFESNLFLYLVSPFGQGKGSVVYSKQTFEKIQTKLELENDQIRKEFKVKMAKYNAEKEEAKSSKNFDRLAELETDFPEDPKYRKLFFSLNNSESNLLKGMNSNGERALFFSSEGDSVTDSMSKEYNQIRSLLNASFHHEPYSFERLSGEKTLKSPKVSLIITSTIDQFFRLIKDPTDGLFSRFLIFEVKPNPEFENVWMADSKNINFEIGKVSDFNLSLFEFLESCDGAPIEFRFTKKQSERLTEIFQREKNNANETDPKMVGLIHRAGFILTRIAMIFSIIKRFENRSLTKGCIVECDESIFNLSLNIMYVFSFYTFKYYDILPKKSFEPKIIKEDKDKINDKMEWIRLYEAGLSFRKISIQLYGNDKSFMKIQRYITKYKAKI